MKTITVPSRDEVSAEAQVYFDLLQKRTGKVANLYATMGYSSNALKAFLEFDETLSKGVFNGKEREAIALAVSEINGCAYCLAGHTVAAKMRGFTQEQTLAIRRGETGDVKLDAIIQLAQSITINKGNADPELLNRFFEAGFNEGALMELVGFVTVRVYTNYVYALTQIPVDFPAAEPLN
jgi:uncharacterized peroxidase-related enzyme